jgi:serine/threonine protein kinase
MRPTAVLLRAPVSFGSEAAVKALQSLRAGTYPLPQDFQNNFRLTCFLGVGTFGDVFEAVRVQNGPQNALPERFAVKLVPRDATDGGFSFELDYAPSVTDETRDPRAKRLRRYLDMNWSDDNFYFIPVEWLGESVTTLEDASLAPEPRASNFRDWLLEILEGLEYLHSRSIEHGDIHSRNVLIVPDGSRLSAKLNDFGESKIVELAAGPAGRADIADFLRMTARLASTISGQEKRLSGEKLDAEGLLTEPATPEMKKADLKALASIKTMLVRSVAPAGRKIGVLPTAGELKKRLEIGTEAKASL